MSVEKLDFNKVKQSKKGFTTSLNDVIQNIPDAFILGVYVYLSSLPPEWDINRVQLMKHFQVGRDKIHKALSWLKNNLLLTYHQERRKDGTLEESTIIIHEGWNFLEKLSTVPLTGLLNNRSTAEPLSGESAPINNIYTKKEIKRKREALSYFLPDEENLLLAKTLNIDLNAEIESFKHRHKGEKNQYEFKRWLEMACKHGASKSNRSFNHGAIIKPNEIKSTVPFYKSEDRSIYNAKPETVSYHMNKIHSILGKSAPSV